MADTRTGKIRTVASSRRAASKEGNGFRKARIKRLAIVVFIVGVTAHLTVNPASADIIGFANGVGYTSNNVGGSPSSFSGNSLTVTNSTLGQANTVFFDTQQSVTGFHASFTYQATDPSGICFCDGAAFILQTSAAGTHAIGGGGGGLGYNGIAPSAAIEFSPDSSGLNPGGPGTGFYTNGGTAQIGGPPLIAFSNIASTHVIEANLSYSGTTLSETLTDLTTSATFSHAFTGIDLASVLGSSMAFVGFSGGTGDGGSTQVLTNFSFTTTSAVPEPSTWAMMLIGFLGLGFAFRRTRRKVSFA